MIFGLDPASQTLFLFSLVLFLFFLVPYSYNKIGSDMLYMSNSTPIWKDKRILTLCAVYAIVFGFRYDYMQDWETYARYYENVQRFGEAAEIREVGFYVLTYVLSRLGFNLYSQFIFEGFIYIFSICYLLKDKKEYLWLVLPLVFTRTPLALVICRQFLAMSFLYIAYRDYCDNKYKKAAILAVVGCSFHVTAIIWLPIFFLFKYITRVRSIWIVGIFLFLSAASYVFADMLNGVAAQLALFFGDETSSAGDYDLSSFERYSKNAISASLIQLLTLTVLRGSYISLFLS